jgi:serpin B
MISPISLEVDLGMFINGLEGETLKEVLKTMGLENYTKEQINDFFKTMMTGIEKADEAAIFKSANAFWYNQRKTVNKDFLTAIQENYAAKTEAVNFGNPQTKDLINYWCAEQTNNRIPKMVDYTNEEDLFHLMNAVYFKAGWEKEFKKDLTTKQPFYYANGKTEEIDMMFENATSIYSESPNLQMTIKPFVDGSFTLALILPKEGVKMEDAIEDVKNYFLSLKIPTETNVTSKEASIKLYVPKFTAEYTEEKLFEYMGNINPLLKFSADDMKFFDDKLSDTDTSCLQKTFFLMDEEGAEAAAITDIMVKNTAVGPGPEPIVLRFDHPFFYAIIESATECPLFIGYYGN